MDPPQSDKASGQRTRPNPPAPPPPPPRTPIADAPPADKSSESSPSNFRPPVPQPPPRPPRKLDHESVPVEVAIEKVINASMGSEPPTEDLLPKNIPSIETDCEETISQRNPVSTHPAASIGSSRKQRMDYERVSELSPPRVSELASSAQPSAARHKPVTQKGSFFLSPDVLGEGERKNQIYHKNQFSEFWMAVFVVLLVVQFTLLFMVGFKPLPTVAFVVLLLLVLASLVCVVFARWLVTKSRLSARRNLRLKNNVMTPEDETDDVPDRAIYLLALGSVLLGLSFAIFTSVIAGSNDINSGGFYAQDTLLQILRFASIVLLALHRTLRPANRVDPMRTIMEVRYRGFAALISYCH